MSKYKPKKAALRRSRAGRKPLSAHGLERRDRKVLAAFTPSQYLALEADAEEEGVSVSELVAQRATGELLF